MDPDTPELRRRGAAFAEVEETIRREIEWLQEKVTEEEEKEKEEEEAYLSVRRSADSIYTGVDYEEEARIPVEREGIIREATLEQESEEGAQSSFEESEGSEPPTVPFDPNDPQKLLDEFVTFAYPPGKDTKYRVARYLGSGAFGSAYIATPGEYVVLKSDKRFIGDAGYDLSDEAVRGSGNSVYHEGQRLISLMQNGKTHPYIIELLGAKAQRGEAHLIALEFAEGGDLEVAGMAAWKAIDVLPLASPRQHRAQENWLEKAGTYMWQVTTAVNYIHSRRWVHRDIKPQNILLVADKAKGGFVAKLADFGLATVGRRDDLVVEFDGAIAYAPPETSPDMRQIGQSVRTDFTADIWALGVSLTEVTLGKFEPFGEYAENFEEFMEETIDNLAAEIKGSEPYVKLIKFILREDPEERPSTWKILNHELMRGFIPPPRPWEIRPMQWDINQGESSESERSSESEDSPAPEPPRKRTKFVSPFTNGKLTDEKQAMLMWTLTSKIIMPLERYTNARDKLSPSTRNAVSSQLAQEVANVANALLTSLNL